MTKGQRIKQRREELNLGQTELAQKVHISKQTLYKYENDIVTNIPSNRLEEIAAALDTTPDYLMGWKEFEIVHDGNIIYDKDAAINELLIETGNKEDIHKAVELYRMFANTTPEVQSAVELLLKSAQHDPESLPKS